MLLAAFTFLALLMQVEAPAEDPRIAKKEYSEEESKTLITAMNRATDEEKECLFGFINDYERDVYTYCKANDLGGDHPVGCEKMAGYGLHEAVLEAALKKCNVDWGNPE